MQIPTLSTNLTPFKTCLHIFSKECFLQFLNQRRSFGHSNLYFAKSFSESYRTDQRILTCDNSKTTTSTECVYGLYGFKTQKVKTKCVQEVKMTRDAGGGRPGVAQQCLENQVTQAKAARVFLTIYISMVKSTSGYHKMLTHSS